MNTRNFFYVCMCSCLILFFSCEDKLIVEEFEKTDNMEKSPAITMELPNLLKFESKESLQNTLEEIKEKKIDLRSDVLLKKLFKGRDELSTTSLRMSSLNDVKFVSLYDECFDREVGNLTTEEWDLINSDSDQLVYDPVDPVISDVYLTSILNNKREIQVDNLVYKYTEEGIYVVPTQNYSLLHTPSLQILSDPNITRMVPGNNESVSSNTSNSTVLPIGALVLSDGISIPANNLRDINFANKSDANALTRFWTNMYGEHKVAIKKISSNRQMTLNFYDQDYLIYHNMGTEVKMQKKVFGIWWNCNADEIRIGWEGIELKEKYNVMPFSNPPKLNFTPYSPYPKLQTHETKSPNWMTKKFPFEDSEQIFLKVPLVNYNITAQHINQIWKAGLSAAEKSLKSYMKAHNKSNTPKEIGLYMQPDLEVITFIIAPREDKKTKKKSMEKKFLSEWFKGTYMIGYTTDPSAPNFKFSKFQFTLKGSSSKLGRGCVYGAVKYKNTWYGARILKSK